MGTNYYRIPTHEEVEKRKTALIKAAKALDISPEFIGMNFAEEVDEDSWDRVTIWDTFLDGMKIHLGKRSSGWLFAWNHNNWKFYKNKEELFSYIRKGRVVNEYGEELSPDEFIEMASNWCLDGFDSMRYLREELLAKGKKPLDSSLYEDIIVDELRFLNSVDFS